jgi:hypothetical protein
VEEDNVNYWSLVEESNFYKRKFEESGPRAGLLDGSASRGVLMETGVEQRDLRRIWDMADIDCDGCLDLEEFTVAMYVRAERAQRRASENRASEDRASELWAACGGVYAK